MQLAKTRHTTLATARIYQLKHQMASLKQALPSLTGEQRQAALERLSVCGEEVKEIKTMNECTKKALVQRDKGN